MTSKTTRKSLLQPARRDDTQTVAAPTPIPIPRPNWPRFNSVTHAARVSLSRASRRCKISKAATQKKKHKLHKKSHEGSAGIQLRRLLKRLENSPKHKVGGADRPTHLASYTETRSSTARHTQSGTARPGTCTHTRRSTGFALLMAHAHQEALASSFAHAQMVVI